MCRFVVREAALSADQQATRHASLCTHKAQNGRQARHAIVAQGSHAATHPRQGQVCHHGCLSTEPSLCPHRAATPKLSPPASSPAKRKDMAKKSPPAAPLQGVWAHKVAASVVHPHMASPSKAAADAKAATKPPPPPPRAAPRVMEPKAPAETPKRAVVNNSPAPVPAMEAASPTHPPAVASPLKIQAMRKDSLDALCSPTSGGNKPPPPPPRAAVTMPANPIPASPPAAAPTSPTAARKLVDSWETWPPGMVSPPAAKAVVEPQSERSLPHPSERALPQSSLSASLYDTTPVDGEAVQAALQAIALRKTLHIASRLRQVGFPEWACMAAVARHGTNLEASLDFLMSLGHGDQNSPEAAAAGTCTG